MENGVKKYANRYRVSSSRLAGFDYGSSGAYFVTICTKNREHFFGNVVRNVLQKSEIGDIAIDCWKMIPERFSFVTLGEWVVMPNHVHGILIIGNDDRKRDRIRRDAIHGVSTFTDVSMSKDTITVTNGSRGGVTRMHNPMLYQNISRIIRWYKGCAAYEMHKINPDFSWQSRFHDRIIRNTEELQKIATYIKNNPQNWEIDELFSAFAKQEK